MASITAAVIKVRQATNIFISDGGSQHRHGTARRHQPPVDGDLFPVLLSSD
jgi:hypothetical protein